MQSNSLTGSQALDQLRDTSARVLSLLTNNNRQEALPSWNASLEEACRQNLSALLALGIASSPSDLDSLVWFTITRTGMTSLGELMPALLPAAPHTTGAEVLDCLSRLIRAGKLGVSPVGLFYAK